MNQGESGEAIAPAFDEYRVLRRLGRGGMGEVWLAQDALLDRLVAIKFIHGIEPDPWARKQFLVEARAAARLSHPNVVTVYRVGENDGRPFLVTEFVRGKSLAEVPKPMPFARALAIALELCRGLSAAHRRGVLHRDIKPANAMVAEDGGVKLLDFGLAKLVEPNRASSASIEPPLEDARPPERAAQRASSRPMIIGGDTMPATRFDGPERISTSTARAPRPVSEIFGTPGYMAPEIWTGEPATRRSDVFSMGALLYELCVGRPPFGPRPGAPFGATRTSSPSLTDVAPGLDPRLAAVIERCLRHDPSERFASAEELYEALEHVASVPRAEAAVPAGNPYRGLAAFEAEHRALFFGRSAEIRAVVERLRADPLVVVAGDSGVGKSSLCRAGVLPLAQEGALGDRRAWRVVRVLPGRRPLAALSAALGMPPPPPPGEREPKSSAHPEALARAVRRGLGEERGLLVFVDQLEELFTMADPADAAAAGEALGRLCAGLSGVRVLVTVRSDFLGRAAALPGLGEEIARALYLLRPLGRDGLREAIVGPARLCGVSLTEPLVEALIEPTARAEGGLPLLQFALAELWHARPDRKRVIGPEALAALGGVGGALSRHADAVIGGLGPARRAAARRMLTALVNLDGTRARRTEEELLRGDPEAREALDALVRGRLVVARDADRGGSYEVAHEALIRGWGTLAQWLSEMRDARAAARRLRSATAEWERLGRSREALWSGRQLVEAKAIDPAAIQPNEVDFLLASRRAVQRRWLGRGALSAAVPLVAGLVWGSVELAARRALGRSVDENVRDAGAMMREARQHHDHAERLRGEAFGAFDGEAWDRAEGLWVEARSAMGEADRSYARASQALEAALSLDPRRADVRALLGDALFERALSVEQGGDPARSEDLVERLALYDEGGVRRAALDAPARLVVQSTPGRALVAVVSFVDDGHGHLHLGEWRTLGLSPTPEVALPRGSYLITADAPGHTPARMPVVLRRGESLRIDIPLPRAPDVPVGFIYVPPGRFLFGSGADEALRREFLSAAPIHELTPGGFLIARHETTYAEYIAFLRSLPPDERALRTPRTGDGSLSGGLELRVLPDGSYGLLLEPVTHGRPLRWDEPLRYPGREARGTQRWPALPVAGVSLDDARAFTDWLDRTGRVPGARLCTEREWERAARGADARELPAGDTLEPDDANFDATYGKDPARMGPDEVGAHPRSASPFGVEDMAGNVFEWTLATSGPIARGGAYAYGLVTCRLTNRSVVDRAFRAATLGIRVCASVRVR